MVKDAVTAIGGNVSYTEIRNYIKSKYGEIKDSTITCQIIVCTVNHPSRVHYPENNKPRIASSKYDFLFTTGRGHVELFKQDVHGIWEIQEDEFGKLTVSQANQEGRLEEGGNIASECDLSFPLESHLRDFIARNIESIKINGKSIRLYVDEFGKDGVEYQTEVGPVDILAVDEDNDFVVFELKLGRGSDKALGQLSRYMGWIKTHLAGNNRTKGVIVVKTASQNLKYSAIANSEISVFEYEMNFTVKPVDL